MNVGDMSTLLLGVGSIMAHNPTSALLHFLQHCSDQVCRQQSLLRKNVYSGIRSVQRSLVELISLLLLHELRYLDKFSNQMLH
jgi:hypothetical protein